MLDLHRFQATELLPQFADSRLERDATLGCGFGAFLCDFLEGFIGMSRATLHDERRLIAPVGDDILDTFLQRFQPGRIFLSEDCPLSLKTIVQLSLGGKVFIFHG